MIRRLAFSDYNEVMNFYAALCYTFCISKMRQYLFGKTLSVESRGELSSIIKCDIIINKYEFYFNLNLFEILFYLKFYFYKSKFILFYLNHTKRI